MGDNKKGKKKKFSFLQIKLQRESSGSCQHRK